MNLRAHTGHLGPLHRIARSECHSHLLGASPTTPVPPQGSPALGALPRTLPRSLGQAAPMSRGPPMAGPASLANSQWQ